MPRGEGVLDQHRRGHRRPQSGGHVGCQGVQVQRRVGVDEQGGDRGQQVVHECAAAVRTAFAVAGGELVPGLADLVPFGAGRQAEQGEQARRRGLPGQPAELVEVGAYLPEQVGVDGGTVGTRRRPGGQHLVPAHPQGEGVGVDAALGGELPQAGELVLGQAAEALHQPGHGGVEVGEALPVPVVTLAADPLGEQAAAPRVEQFLADLVVRGQQREHQAPVLGWSRDFCQKAHTWPTRAATSASVSRSTSASGMSYSSKGSDCPTPPRAWTAARTRLR